MKDPWKGDVYMAFGIGMHASHTEHTLPEGNFKKIAVKCWFTSNGQSIPLMFKYENDKGEIVPVENIRVLTAEKQWYAGILTWKYVCKASSYGKETIFSLLFTPEDCSWKIMTN